MLKKAYTGLQEVPEWIINLIMENWRGVEQLANKLFLTGIFNLRDIKSREVEREDGLNNQILKQVIETTFNRRLINFYHK